MESIISQETPGKKKTGRNITKSSVRITATGVDVTDEHGDDTQTWYPSEIDDAVQKALIKFQVGLGDVYHVLQVQKSVTDS